ncbi:hypothetical protein MNBD_ALPHA02-159, partial [hydrothermal vent metagenome]
MLLTLVTRVAILYHLCAFLRLAHKSLINTIRFMTIKMLFRPLIDQSILLTNTRLALEPNLNGGAFRHIFYDLRQLFSKV